jgi:hypothetical protein
MWTNERCRAWAKAKRPNTFMNRESDVTIETMVLAGQGFDFGVGKRFFFISKSSRTALEPSQPPIQ